MQPRESTRRFIKIIDKIPMFQKLNPNQAIEILKICKPRSFGSNQIVCEHGTNSTEMFILLSGKLTIVASDGIPLTQLSPITIVGEMGVITGSPRSARVVTEEKVSIFEISKLKFDLLIKKDPDMGFIVYRNFIRVLSQRLDQTNEKLSSCNRELTSIRGSNQNQGAVSNP